MDDEGAALVEGYIWLFIGLIGFGFGAYFGIIPAILGFFGWIAVGVYILINTFMKYQWPNRHEYLDYWRMHWTR